MSEAPPTPPTPGPDADDGRGLEEPSRVVRAKRPPTASGQSGTTLYSEMSPIGTGKDPRDMESYEGPSGQTKAKTKAP